MIKLVFLVSETKQMINKWPGLTARTTRAVKEGIVINGIGMTEALIYDREKIKNFYFIPVESPEEIIIIMEKINNFPQRKLKRMFTIENEKKGIMRIFKIEVVVVVSKLSPFHLIFVGDKRSRYHCNLNYGWVFFLNGSIINNQAINEFAACFFREKNLDDKLALAHKKSTRRNNNYKSEKEFIIH